MKAHSVLKTDSYATFTNSAPKSCYLCKQMQQQPPEIKLTDFAQQALSGSFIYILPVNRLQELYRVYNTQTVFT